MKKKSPRKASPWFNCWINPMGKPRFQDTSYPNEINYTRQEAKTGYKRTHKSNKCLGPQQRSYLKDMMKAGTVD